MEDRGSVSPLTKSEAKLYQLDSGIEWEGGLFEHLILGEDSQWEDLCSRYAPSDLVPRPADAEGLPWDRGRPWRRTLAVARQLEAKAAVIERRYVDKDYRSEYGALYSNVLAPVADTTHRLHFFSDELQGFSFDRLADASGDFVSLVRNSYLGYVVCRPAPLETVGRTLLRPPPQVSVRTAIRERVNFFGTNLEAVGVPFMQQDQRLGVCAHVGLWILLYSAHRCADASVHTIADIVRLAHGTADGRIGLLDDEAIAALQTAGLRPQMASIRWDLPQQRGFPWKTPEPATDAPDWPVFAQPRSEEVELERRLADAVLPILNSGVPVYVGSTGHASVLCGYSTRDVACGNGDSEGIVYTLHDDQCGPYIQLYSPARDFRVLRNLQAPGSLDKESIGKAMNAFSLAEDLEALPDLIKDTRAKALSAPDLDEVTMRNRRAWETLIFPMPENVHLSCHAMEQVALEMFEIRLLSSEGKPSRLVNYFDEGDEIQHTEDLWELRSTGDLEVRSYFAKTPYFKSALGGRGLPASVVSHYKRSRFSANVHVCELINGRRSSKLPRVLGEIIFDATSGDTHPWVHAVRIGHSLEITQSDGCVRTGPVGFEYANTGFPGARSAKGRSFEPET